MMKKLLLALLLTTTTAAAQSPDLAKIAASLPPLPARAGNIVVPLDGAGAFRWQSIGGAAVDYDGGSLRARYTIASGKPSGAALLIPAGALDGVTQLRVRIRGSRNAPLVVSLQDGKGVAYAFPSVALRAGVRELTLETEDLAFSMHQSRVADPGAFRIGEAILVSVVDITGFMSAETPGVEWTIDSLEGVRP